MKRLALLLGVAAVTLPLLPSAQAQFRGGSYYTRRIAPPPARPAPPAAAAPAGATAAAPVDSEKAKAEREAAVKRAVEFQKKRAEGGSSTAQYDLGVRYLEGDGVGQDFKLARKWLEAAVKGGHKWAPKKLEELAKLEAEAAKEQKAEKPTKPPEPKKK